MGPLLPSEPGQKIVCHVAAHQSDTQFVCRILWWKLSNSACRILEHEMSPAFVWNIYGTDVLFVISSCLDLLLKECFNQWADFEWALCLKLRQLPRTNALKSTQDLHGNQCPCVVSYRSRNHTNGRKHPTLNIDVFLDPSLKSTLFFPCELLHFCTFMCLIVAEGVLDQTLNTLALRLRVYFCSFSLWFLAVSTTPFSTFDTKSHEVSLPRRLCTCVI